MASGDLTLFSYEILGLVGREGAGAHDLLRLARRGRMLAWAGESQYYTEPKRLARLGYLSSRKEPGKTRERTYYTLTEKGFAALADWLDRPSSFPRIQSEAALRVQGSDLARNLESVVASVTAMRAEIEEQSRLLDQGER